MKYEQGSDTLEPGADYMTFPIDAVPTKKDEKAWGAQIVVYGDPILRKRILDLLNGHVDPRPDINPDD